MKLLQNFVASATTTILAVSILSLAVPTAVATNSNNRNACYDFDIYANGLDAIGGYEVTDFGAVANLPFYDATTDEALGTITFSSFNVPGDCIYTTGIFTFTNDQNQVTYAFTTCNGSSGDIITGGSGEYVGAYGKNSLVTVAFPIFTFKLEFCTPPN